MKTMDTLHGHRHSPPGQHEHEYEPAYGLPEALPADEKVLWQGSPDWKSLAISRFHVRKLVVYFAAMLAVRVWSQMSDGLGLFDAIQGSMLMLALAALAIGLLSGMAWFTARTTVYTMTNKRMVMRIGIVLTMTLNLPFKRVEAADLKLHGGGDGDISLKLLKPDRIAYLHLWPHSRAWRLARPEPTLLCVPKAQAVAERLLQAWQSVQVDATQTRHAAAKPSERPVAAQPGPSGVGMSGELAQQLATR